MSTNKPLGIVGSLAPDQINVAMIVPRTEAEGPGVRYSLWVQGCPMRCAGCCNPEMLLFETRTIMTVADIAAQIEQTPGEGVSLLGGEPFAQAQSLSLLAERIQQMGKTVMVYTGFTLAELREQKSVHVDRLLANIDLLVDGRYDPSLRTTERRWIGSTNQVLHFMTNRYHPDDPQFSEPNTVELRLTGNTITLNGWPLSGAATKALEPSIRRSR